jgi:hypothetical protein
MATLERQKERGRREEEEGRRERSVVSGHGRRERVGEWSSGTGLSGAGVPVNGRVARSQGSGGRRGRDFCVVFSLARGI